MNKFLNNVSQKIENNIFIFENISNRNKKRFFLLCFITLITFLAEITQLSFLRLFIRVIEENNTLNSGIDQVGNNFLIGNISILNFGILFISILFVSTFFRIFMLNYAFKAAAYISEEIAIIIYKKVIQSPYYIQLANSDSFNLALITKDSENLCYLLLAYFSAFCHLTLVILLLIVLIIVNPSISISIIIPISLVYTLIILSTRKKINNLGEKIILSNEAIIKTSLNSLGSIKNLIIDNSYSYFIDLYHEKINENRFSTSSVQFIFGYPKILVEFALILILIFLISLNYGKLTTTQFYWSQLISITFGMFRLISPLHTFYVQYTRTKELEASQIRIVKLLKDSKNREKNYKNINFKIDILRDKNKIIELKNVFFSYPNSNKFALRNISFEAFRGETIAIVGRSGSGKSTFFDILMGLLLPTEGRISVNINSSKSKLDILREWQKNISFVPQNVYLLEDTVKANIALGIPKDKINFNEIKLAAEKVNLSKIIMGLPKQYDEILLRNEKSKFSGGEAQKLGIARGIHKGKKILFFDEISSSLDQSSENEIISLIQSLDKETTKFIISHNINKINYADKIVVFNNGAIEAIDTYENLIKKNETFRKLKKESFLN